MTLSELKAIAISQHRQRLFAKRIEQKLPICQQLTNATFQRKAIFQLAQN